MKSPPGRVTAEALFGSASRRDNDPSSDVDYLIVDSDYAKLRARKSWLASRGFSVSDYTWTRLERLIVSGALFATHLKLESRVIHDPSFRLRNLLQNSTPKASYAADFGSSLSLFSPLAGTPLTSEGIAWACDVAAVAFRNAAILQLASDGIYAFGNEDIIAALKKKGRITPFSSNTFRQLRAAKHAYRTHSGEGSLSFLRSALVEIERALGEPIRDLAYCRTLFTAAPSTDAYGFARSVERDLLSLDLPPSMTGEKARLLREIRDPHTYLWRFIKHRPEVAGRIARLGQAGRPNAKFLSAA